MPKIFMPINQSDLPKLVFKLVHEDLARSEEVRSAMKPLVGRVDAPNGGVGRTWGVQVAGVYLIVQFLFGD